MCSLPQAGLEGGYSWQKRHTMATLRTLLQPTSQIMVGLGRHPTPCHPATRKSGNGHKDLPANTAGWVCSERLSTLSSLHRILLAQFPSVRRACLADHYADVVVHVGGWRRQLPFLTCCDWLLLTCHGGPSEPACKGNGIGRVSVLMTLCLGEP